MFIVLLHVDHMHLFLFNYCLIKCLHIVSEKYLECDKDVIWTMLLEKTYLSNTIASQMQANECFTRTLLFKFF